MWAGGAVLGERGLGGVLVIQSTERKKLCSMITLLVMQGKTYIFIHLGGFLEYFKRVVK